MIRTARVEYSDGRSATRLGNIPPPGSEERWQESRHLTYEQSCYFCWSRIPKGWAPDKRTKAWFCKELGLWRCNSCQAEETRAELAGQRAAA